MSANPSFFSNAAEVIVPIAAKLHYTEDIDSRTRQPAESLENTLLTVPTLKNPY